MDHKTTNEPIQKSVHLRLKPRERLVHWTTEVLERTKWSLWWWGSAMFLKTQFGGKGLWLGPRVWQQAGNDSQTQTNYGRPAETATAGQGNHGNVSSMAFKGCSQFSLLHRQLIQKDDQRPQPQCFLLANMYLSNDVVCIVPYFNFFPSRRRASPERPREMWRKGDFNALQGKEKLCVGEGVNLFVKTSRN